MKAIGFRGVPFLGTPKQGTVTSHMFHSRGGGRAARSYKCRFPHLYLPSYPSNYFFLVFNIWGFVEEVCPDSKRAWKVTRCSFYFCEPDEEAPMKVWVFLW